MFLRDLRVERARKQRRVETKLAGLLEGNGARVIPCPRRVIFKREQYASCEKRTHDCSCAAERKVEPLLFYAVRYAVLTHRYRTPFYRVFPTFSSYPICKLSDKPRKNVKCKRAHVSSAMHVRATFASGSVQHSVQKFLRDEPSRGLFLADSVVV